MDKSIEYKFNHVTGEYDPPIPNNPRHFESVAEALPKEMARVRVVLGYYKELGPVGAIGAMLIEQDLLAADVAVMSGNVVEMLQAYQKLQGVTG